MKPFRAAALQTSPRFGEVENNLEAALAALPADCDLVVLPELFNTGYQFTSRDELQQLAEPIPDGPTSRRLLAEATARGIHLVAGLAENDGAGLFNTCLLARPDGSWERYRKIHLFWEEKDIFDPGDLGFSVVPACGTEIGLMICFDWIQPEAARTLALAGATVLCHPSNLVLPHCPNAMITRSLENRVYVILANRVGSEDRKDPPLRFIGQSRVIDPRGEVLATCDGQNPGAAAATIDPTAALDKQVTPRNHLWQDRRPETYRL